MIYVSPIKFNNIDYPTRKNISFKEGLYNNVTSNEAVLSLQSPDALVKFQKDFKMAHNSDAFANPFKALYFKVKRALNAFFKPRLDEGPYDLSFSVFKY